jgi:hypothetical protein
MPDFARARGRRCLAIATLRADNDDGIQPLALCGHKDANRRLHGRRARYWLHLTGALVPPDPQAERWFSRR